MPFNLLGVSGSLREASFGAQALRLVLAAAAELGDPSRLLDLRQVALPLYNPDRPDDDPQLQEVNEAVGWADALVLASPDYHGSMSGAMKNFLDYHWEHFGGKLFGYVCASHEKGLTAMDQMRTAVRQCYGWSLPYGISVHGEVDFDAQGTPSRRLADRLRMLARDMTVYGQLLRGQFHADLSAGVADTFSARYR
ncbi:MAG TPA: NADPH-dependent FMN reductase [Pirellulales bacterium]